MKKNIIQTIKITSEMKSEIKKISEITGFKQVDLIRFLINRSLMQLKVDCKGDYKLLEFTLRHI